MVKVGTLSIYIYMSNTINIGKKEKCGLKWFTAGEACKKMQCYL